MRPEHEWFKPEKLAVYLFIYEGFGLFIVGVGIGFFAAVGVVAEAPSWVLGGVAAVLLAAFGYLTWWIRAFVATADFRFTDEEIEFRRGVFYR